MKAKELIALLEYGKAFGPKPEKPSRKRKDEPEIPDAEKLISLLDKKEREVALIKEWLGKQEKLNKKEDKKKEGWESFSFIKKFTILTATVPLAMMGYSLLFLLFAKACAKVFGG